MDQAVKQAEELAEQALTLAQTSSSEDVKQTLLEIAENYHQLARDLECDPARSPEFAS